jgi:hypothetical protein
MHDCQNPLVTISLDNSNQLIFVMDVLSVLCDVGTGFEIII